MNRSKGQTPPGRPKSSPVAEAIARGNERFKRALEYIKHGYKDMVSQEWDAAIAEYTEAIRLDPNHNTAYLLRAKAYEAKGDEAKAEADVVIARSIAD